MTVRPVIVPIDMGGSPSRCIIAPAPTTPPEPATVVAMIDHYRTERLPEGGSLEVAFYRGGIPSDALLEACGGLPVRVSCHPADLGREDATRLKAGGCGTVELEILSFDPYVLRNCRREYTIGRVEGMIRVLQEMGFSIGVHLTPGLPGSDLQTSQMDVARLAEQRVDFARLWPALAFEGAALADWVEDGRWMPLSVADAVAVVEVMMEGLEAASIPVARVGLQPGQDIPAQVVAGPYHPNLRGEVETRRFRRRMVQALAKVEAGSSVVVRVHPKDLGWAKGTSNTNARALRTRLGLSAVRIESDPAVDRGTIAVGVCA